MPEIKEESESPQYGDDNRNYTTWDAMQIEDEYILPHRTPITPLNEGTSTSNDTEGMSSMPGHQHSGDLLYRLNIPSQNALPQLHGAGGPVATTSGLIGGSSGGVNPDDFTPEQLREIESLNRDLYLRGAGIDEGAHKIEPNTLEFSLYLDPNIHAPNNLVHIKPEPAPSEGFRELLTPPSDSSSSEPSSQPTPGPTQINPLSVSSFIQQLGPSTTPVYVHTIGTQSSGLQWPGPSSYSPFSHQTSTRSAPPPYLGQAIAQTSSSQYNGQPMAYYVGSPVVSPGAPTFTTNVAPGPSSAPAYTTAPISNSRSHAPTTTTSSLAAAGATHLNPTWGQQSPTVLQDFRSSDSRSQQHAQCLVPDRRVTPLPMNMSSGDGLQMGAVGGGHLPMHGLPKQQGHGESFLRDTKDIEAVINSLSTVGVARTRCGSGKSGNSSRSLGSHEARCELCSVRCASSGHLKRHMSSHGANRRFKCHVCNCSYSRQDNHKRHLRKAHGIGSD